MIWSGTPGNILIVGMGPGDVDDVVGKQFQGPAGLLLKRAVLTPLGITPDMVAFTNAVRCNPPKNSVTIEMIELCRPFLQVDIVAIQPKKIICLGEHAARAVLNLRECTIKSMAGRVYRSAEVWNYTPTIVTYHPSAVLRNTGWLDVVCKHVGQFVHDKMPKQEFKELQCV